MIATASAGSRGSTGAPVRPRKESLADVLRRRSSEGTVERQERAAAVQQSLASLMTGGQGATDETSPLAGSLTDVGVVPALRRLAGLRKSGRLEIVAGRWVGELWLALGQVVAGFCGAEQGVEALDAVAVAVTLSRGEGTFAFEETEHVPLGQLPQPLSAEQVAARIESLSVSHLAAVLRDPTAVPRVPPRGREESARTRWQTVDAPPPEELEPPTLRLLLAVDGRQTVEQLAKRFGLARTARGLAKLSTLGLVDESSLSAAPSTPSAAWATSRDASISVWLT